MITSPSIWAALADAVNNGVFTLVGSGAPTSGTSGTANGIAGPGSTYTDIATGLSYTNVGTKASPNWTNQDQLSLGTAIASTATIAPTSTIHHITGTVAIVNITPPVSGFQSQLTLIPDAAFTTTTAGNIALASTGVVSKALIMTYDATANKWYPSY